MLRDEICVMACVALIWGTTNSLVKNSSKEYVTGQSNNKKKANFEIYDSYVYIICRSQFIGTPVLL